MCNLFVSVLILNKYMIIERNEYLDQLLAKKWNGKVKIITGIRRSGKSFLLSTLFKNKMIKEGVAADDFINIDLDRKSNIKFRNPNVLYDYIIERTKDFTRKFYVLIDEIQLSYKVKNSDIDESLVAEEDRLSTGRKAPPSYMPFPKAKNSLWLSQPSLLILCAVSVFL